MNQTPATSTSSSSTSTQSAASAGQIDPLVFNPCTARHFSNKARTLVNKAHDLRDVLDGYNLSKHSSVLTAAFDRADDAFAHVLIVLENYGDKDNAKAIREERKKVTAGKRDQQKAVRLEAKKIRDEKRVADRAARDAEREAIRAKKAAAAVTPIVTPATLPAETIPAQTAAKIAKKDGTAKAS